MVIEIVNADGSRFAHDVEAVLIEGVRVTMRELLRLRKTLDVSGADPGVMAHAYVMDGQLGPWLAIDPKPVAAVSPSVRSGPPGMKEVERDREVKVEVTLRGNELAGVVVRG